MGRIRKSAAGDHQIIVPEGKAARREAPKRAPGGRWGSRLAWIAIAVGAAGLILWRVFVLMRP